MQPLNELINQRRKHVTAIHDLDAAIATHPEMIRRYLSEADRPVPDGLVERVTRMTHEFVDDTEAYTFTLDNGSQHRVRIDTFGVALYGAASITNLPTEPMAQVPDHEWLEWLAERSAQVQVAYLLASNHY